MIKDVEKPCLTLFANPGFNPAGTSTAGSSNASPSRFGCEQSPDKGDLARNALLLVRNATGLVRIASMALG